MALVNEQECHLMPEKKMEVKLEAVADAGQQEGEAALEAEGVDDDESENGDSEVPQGSS